MNIAIINGRVVDPSQKLDKKINILITDGKISGYTSSRQIPSGYQIIDATDLVIVPGLVDMHCHLRDPGHTGKEDIASGTMSAAAGGFTSIACMANTVPVNDTATITKYILDACQTRAYVKVHVIGAVSKGLKGEVMADMAAMKQAGIVAVSDDGMCVMNAQLMRRALEYADTLDLPVIIHAEDECMCSGAVMHEGAVSTRLGLVGKPAESEEIIVKRDIALARMTGARLHVAHVSSAESVDAIAQAKKDGLRITAEVTPHHLTLTDEALLNYNVNAKVNPPIRDERHRKALIRALKDGTIDVIATDHAPHTVLDKDCGMDQAACGMVGFETAFSLGYKLVTEKQISLAQLIERMSTTPASLLGIDAGSLKKGMSADITIVNPSATWVVNSSAFLSKSKNSPFDGWKLPAPVVYTLVNGKVVYQNERFIAS